METQWLDPYLWAEQQWSTLRLGDPRRTRRAVQLGTALASCPEGSLPQQCGTWAELKAAYRLLDGSTLDHPSVCRAHWQHTRAQAEQTARPVLFIQDTTTLDFSAHPATVGLGHIGDTHGQGLMVHTALTVTTKDAVPQILGLAWQQTWTRTAVNKGHETRSERAKRRTEYDVWAETVQAIGPAPPGCTWVSVGDRGSDVFSYLRIARQLDWHVLIRLAQNRCVRTAQGDDKILDWMRRHPPVSTISLSRPAEQGRPKCEVVLGIAYDVGWLYAPKNGAERHHPAQQVWCVRAYDLATGGQELEWVLLSTLPVTTIDQALEKTTWYASRWLVEDYHKCLKTGCRIEDRQLRTAERLTRLLGFLSLVAVRLLWLRNASRSAGDEPAQSYVPTPLVQVIATRLRQPVEEVQLRTFWRAVAALGGFLGRAGDGEPGWQTLWRGWLRLQDLAWTPQSIQGTCG
ncbi:IS4 family transposase [Deinococcus sp. MIMF12]|uniref:IS4 family transposase n=1 Tax=Deinococcus rhizophilus TaxID=3049544 RepID=A0ABT7JD81_9DEIO|nr:IS4 family transposase [Deinococcus rhizophilus]MDL2342987.1 IS4 family transposase [Deinococcus rhizophilus]